MARVFLIDPEALKGLEEPEAFYKAYHGAATSLVYGEAAAAIEAVAMLASDEATERSRGCKDHPRCMGDKPLQ